VFLLLLRLFLSKIRRKEVMQDKTKMDATTKLKEYKRKDRYPMSQHLSLLRVSTKQEKSNIGVNT
jgi:hypothetical protein